MTIIFEMAKSCTKCKEIKANSEFYTITRSKDKKRCLDSTCKVCKSELAKAYYSKNSDTIKRQFSEYYSKNKERHAKTTAAYYKRKQEEALHE